MKDKIWLSPPDIGELEKKYVDEAFESNWVAPAGKNIDNFELELSSCLGSEVHTAVLSSGTAAIHLGLKLLGVERGDEVLCQSMTFCGTSNPILYEGAIPIFIDSENETWNMSALFLEEAIKNRVKKGRKLPKAIIPVHLYGMPAQMDKIMSISEEYGIPVLEDAAEALGSHINGKMCGTFGDIGVLSFNGNKIITTSAGGALLSSNSSIVDSAKFLATQARESVSYYEHFVLGYNYRMSNICAGIGRGQLYSLEEKVKARRKVYDNYKDFFSNYPGINVLNEPTGHYSNRWLTTIVIDSEIIRNLTIWDLREALEFENIESRPLWKPMHMQTLYKSCEYYGSNTSQKLFENGLCLPSGSSLTVKDQHRIFEVMKKVFSMTYFEV